MGLSPDQCLAFEDSQSGLRAARAAGIRTVVTVTEYTRWQDLGSAELVVDHLGESTLPFRLLPSNADYDRARQSVGDRHGTFACETPHAHRDSDALDEIGLWLDWLETRGAERIVLLGHSRSGNQVKLFVIDGADHFFRDLYAEEIVEIIAEDLAGSSLQ